MFNVLLDGSLIIGKWVTKFRLPIKLLCVCQLANQWKYLVFLSPSLSQRALTSISNLFHP